MKSLKESILSGDTVDIAKDKVDDILNAIQEMGMRKIDFWKRGEDEKLNRKLFGHLLVKKGYAYGTYHFTDGYLHLVAEPHGHHISYIWNQSPLPPSKSDWNTGGRMLMAQYDRVTTKTEMAHKVYYNICQKLCV